MDWPPGGTSVRKLAGQVSVGGSTSLTVIEKPQDPLAIDEVQATAGGEAPSRLSGGGAASPIHPPA